MIMKMHSYMSTNGYLLKVNHNFEKKMDTLRSATSRIGGWDAALTEAQAAKDENEKRSGSTSDELSASPSITPLPDGTKRSYIDGDMAMALRDRRTRRAGYRSAGPGVAVPPRLRHECTTSRAAACKKVYETLSAFVVRPSNAAG